MSAPVVFFMIHAVLHFVKHFFVFITQNIGSEATVRITLELLPTEATVRVKEYWKRGASDCVFWIQKL